MTDPVNHPRHYTAHQSGVECIEITRHLSFSWGNAVKYAWRASLKNGAEDVRKAAWYVRDADAHHTPLLPRTIDIEGFAALLLRVLKAERGGSALFVVLDTIYMHLDVTRRRTLADRLDALAGEAS